MSNLKYPAVPEYIHDYSVFADAKLGIAMVGFWNEKQWIFAVRNNSWVSIRPVVDGDFKAIEQGRGRTRTG